MKTWFTYIVRCVDNSLYTGISIDVEKRIKLHNSGLGAAYTRSHKPVTLVWKEKAKSSTAARKREAQIKKLTKSMKEDLIA
ncbi:MAG: GIY-YIG nuclease family protein [Patescibacteria group bacterium]|nr:GIY-YIG nuclease family protein [Patescibacteria group bacterium]MBU2509202.1 GIY-YIG nuclease family protein [Patescibacteria group bacterium]